MTETSEKCPTCGVWTMRFDPPLELEVEDDVDALVDSLQRAERAEAQVARIRAFLEDMAGFGFPRDIYAQRGLEILDGVDGVAGPATQVSEPTARELGESLAFAMDAMLPAAEPVFCHHPDARRTVHETMQAGWGRCAVVRLECPTCQAWAQQLNDEPVLAPKLLNAGRCTEACTEQHTARPGCLLAPDFSKPILRSEP